MAKAVLIMDMPKYCEECDIAEHSKNGIEWCTYYGHGCGRSVCQPYTKPSWCPLRELPERETEMTDEDDLGKDYVRGTMDGWNACLEEIYPLKIHK